MVISGAPCMNCQEGKQLKDISDLPLDLAV